MRIRKQSSNWIYVHFFGFAATKAHVYWELNLNREFRTCNRLGPALCGIKSHCSNYKVWRKVYKVGDTGELEIVSEYYVVGYRLISLTLYFKISHSASEDRVTKNRNRPFRVSATSHKFDRQNIHMHSNDNKNPPPEIYLRKNKQRVCAFYPLFSSMKIASASGVYWFSKWHNMNKSGV